MKKHFSRGLALVLCMALLTGILPAFTQRASADRMYLIPDSNSRKLTEAELWDWDYESLGYILNEIFARHGYVFQPGGKYAYYFGCMPWYTPNSSSDNSRYCYPKLNNVEWYNERLVKQVRQQMRDMHVTNKHGRSVWSGFSTGFSVLQGFDYASMKGKQKLDVFSAPSASSWRGANGKAMVNTNGAVYAAGWENGWMLVMYETNNGGVRVGYVNGSKIKGKVSVNKSLHFEYSSASVLNSVSLTDDPAASYTTITRLNAGASVTYLTTFFNHYAWDYVETRVDGQTVRGFIRSGNLDITGSDSEDDELADAAE